MLRFYVDACIPNIPMYVFNVRMYIHMLDGSNPATSKAQD